MIHWAQTQSEELIMLEILDKKKWLLIRPILDIIFKLGIAMSFWVSFYMRNMVKAQMLGCLDYPCQRIVWVTYLVPRII